MKKRFGFLFAIYCVIIIILLITFLVVLPKQNTEQTYADEIMLAIPRNISLNINEEIILKDNYISVKPSYLKNKISTEITKNNGGLTFENNTLKALLPGSYTVKFSVPGKKAALNEYLMVTATDKNAKASLNYPIVYEQKNYDISDLLTFNSDLEYQLTIDNIDIANLNNSSIYFKSAGMLNMCVEFFGEYCNYKYTFTITILKNEGEILPEEYAITINNIYRDEEYLIINYSVLLNELDDVDQTITTNVIGGAEVAKINSPLIYIIPHSKDKITVEIYSVNAKISKSIEIDLNLYF